MSLHTFLKVQWSFRAITNSIYLQSEYASPADSGIGFLWLSTTTKPAFSIDFRTSSDVKYSRKNFWSPAHAHVLSKASRMMRYPPFFSTWLSFVMLVSNSLTVLLTLLRQRLQERTSKLPTWEGRGELQLMSAGTTEVIRFRSSSSLCCTALCPGWPSSVLTIYLQMMWSQHIDLWLHVWFH